MQIETTKSERQREKGREREETEVMGATSFSTVCSWDICQIHAMKAQTNNKLSKISFEFIISIPSWKFIIFDFRE